MKNSNKYLKVLVLCIIALIIIISVVFNKIFGEYTLKSTKVFEIKKGDTISKIFEKLEREKYIRTKLSFKILSKLKKYKKATIKAGKYVFKAKMKPSEIYDILIAGLNAKDEMVNIVVKEGLNIKDIAEILNKNTKISKQAFIDKVCDRQYLKKLINKYDFLDKIILDKNVRYPLEGYLFPDTYILSREEKNPEIIISMMLNNMKKVLIDLNYTNRKYESLHSILTLASIVELESSKDEESKKIITSVFINRLKNNMTLGSDVTAYYEVSKKLSDGDLTMKELNKEGYYNTRSESMRGKLPIGPISSPSKSSIRVALNPKESDYLYFVSDKHGNIYPSKTYDEHLKIVKKLKEQGDWFEY